MTAPPPRTIAGYLDAYADGERPAELLAATHAAITACDDPGIFLDVIPLALLMEEAGRLPPYDPVAYPLWGVPFAVKDNIDVAGRPTTAACPAFAYTPGADAPAVARLCAAGAIPVAKTNLDQFATGLVGVRTPHPVPRNSADPLRVPGGSSSGSAVAVARGLVPFALGTDTAGSGRVPAALNGIVGLKPSPGAVSSRGVVPACRSLDCVSVFAQGAGEAWAVFDVMRGYDGDDPFAKPFPADDATPVERLGIPALSELIFDEPEAEAAWESALPGLAALAPDVSAPDIAPFLAIARMLYESALVAERDASFGEFLRANLDAVDPTVRAITLNADRFTATDVFRAQHQFAALRRASERVWDHIDALVLPSVPQFPTLAALEADRIGPNARLGTYTNFVNLLGLAAIAVPGPRRPDGLPAGVTFIGPFGSDARLARLAARYLGEAA
ncbi:allophanate hydrolase [Plastoroseomonas arctica]|uniref:allophanate hydrolase n=1 Tax=Plastoroseomonas arctica TaxID=1509237 RepID=UPI001BA4CF2F|nr:allophanate hydrolase [Plastoroseomonas arctica]